MDTILLVDDEELERIYQKQAIEQRGKSFKVVGEAANGREAIELATKLLPNIILMDIRMPGINGLEAIKEIKILHPEISCIIISAYEEFSYVQKALRLGAEEYLLKPVSADEIFSVLEVIKHQRKKPIKEYIDQLPEKDLIFNKYPLNKEKLLILALKNHDITLFSNAFREFSQELIQISKTISTLKTYMLELNTVLSRGLLDSGLDPQKILPHARGCVQATLSISSTEEAINYLETYKFEIIDLINPNKTSNKDLVENILTYIDRNISKKNISLEELSQHFHFSTCYISRVIKKETGLTFSEHLNQIRLTEAKILLRNSAININQIATLVGYNEVPHFNRMFKKSVGISPSKYRRLLLER
ncbi:hypothetical protein JCM15765_29800 [Paradesulfitobacterium aromaticivorans]